MTTKVVVFGCVLLAMAQAVVDVVVKPISHHPPQIVGHEVRGK
jgi:hypothetical protein